MSYGIGYKGSKSRIANDILAVLPDGRRFCDLFGGGFAMSHAALLSGKYDCVLYNDANALVVQLIENAVSGEYNPDRFAPTWISREEFNAKRDSDGYIKYLWSYGNNGKEYIYSHANEELKHCAFDAVCLPTYRERRIALKQYTRMVNSSRLDLSSLEQLDRLARLEGLERLTRLEGLEKLTRLQITAEDYRDYKHRDGDVVYCDIPYEENNRSDGYNYDMVEFSHSEFYEWAISRTYPVFFSSTHITAKGFKCIWQKEKNTTMKSNSNSIKRIEKLYVQEWYEPGAGGI